MQSFSRLFLYRYVSANFELLAFTPWSLLATAHASLRTIELSERDGDETRIMHAYAQLAYVMLLQGKTENAATV